MLLSPEQRIKNTALMMDPPGDAAGRQARARDADDARSDSARSQPQARHRPGHDRVLLLRHQAGQRARGSASTRSARSRATGTIVIRGKDPTSGALRSARRHRRHARARDEPHHRLRLRRAPGDRHRRGQLRPLQGRVPRLLHRAALGVLGHARAGRARGRDPRPPVGTSEGRGRLRRPRRRVLGRAARHQHSSAATVLAHRRPDGFNLDNSPYLDRLVHLLRDAEGRQGRRSRSRCSRSASSPPPSAPRRRARR